MKKKGMERKRRLLTVKKKTMELATLCGVKACTICLGPNGEIETWPEQPTEVKAIIESFKQYRNNDNREKKIPQTPNSPSREFSSLSSAQPSVDETVSVKKDDLRKVFSVWSDDWLHGFSVDGLRDLWAVMELKLQAITARIELLNAQNNSQEGGDCSALASFPESNMYEFPLQTLGGDNFEMAQGFQQPFQSIEAQIFRRENFEMTKSFQKPLQTVESHIFERENFPMAHCFQQPLQSVESETSVGSQTSKRENFEIAHFFQQPLQSVEPQTFEGENFDMVHCFQQSLQSIEPQTFGGVNFEMATGFQQPLQIVEPIQIPLQTFGGENFEMAKHLQQPLQSIEPIQFSLQAFERQNFEMTKGFQQSLQSVEPINYSYSYPDAQTVTPMWEAARGSSDSSNNEGVFSYAPMLVADVGQLNYYENVVNMSAPWEYSQTFELTNLDFMSSQVADQFNETFGGPALNA